MHRGTRTLLHSTRSWLGLQAIVPVFRRWTLTGILLALSPALGIAQVQHAVQLDGVDDYVTFGAAPGLSLPVFTIEVRFKRTGSGVTTSTGVGGLDAAIPLITKGRGELDGDNRDMNYFLGIRASDNVLVADYEEGTGQTFPGLNHPVAGVTPVTSDVWHHAAATFDGTTWRLYLDGNLDATLVVGPDRLPQSASIQHAGLGTAMLSSGFPGGFFQGSVEEARIWSVARGDQEILDGINVEILSAPDLVGRWGLNEGAGVAAGNSIVGSPGGTLANGALWTDDSTVPLAGLSALRFGPNSYVTFGDAAALKLSQFTLETWFRRDGPGTGTSTGAGGIPDAVPLIAKGRGEADSPELDMNYILGIRASDSVLVADFEEGSSGTTPSGNHPLAGVTPLARGVWYHAAATYDGTALRLYLNGTLEAEVVVGQPPAAAGTQHASLAAALNSTGEAEGRFNGALDEVRVWSVGRSQLEIQSAMNLRFPGTVTDLVARWGLDEDAETTIHSTAGTTLDAPVVGTGWSWAAGAPFDVAPPAVPDPPTNLSAISSTWARVDLTWTDVSQEESVYEIERSTTGSGGPFTLIATRPANSTTFSDLGLDPEAEFCYQVRAVNATGASAYAGPACATTPPLGNSALALGVAGAHGRTPDSPSLRLQTFTIELWFRRDGPGTGTDTGVGGILDAIPLLAKGRAEADAAAVDVNYLLGIRAANGVLCADFEEGPSGLNPGQNHPIEGITPIPLGGWHHVALTYDGSVLKLYLDGLPETQLAVGQPPAYASTSAVALGSALNSSNVAAGFFQGALDEVRIWNVARSQSEIQANAHGTLTGSVPGLVAHWGLEEGSGAAFAVPSGTITGAGYTWIPGAPLDLAFNQPPGVPQVVAPAHQATNVSSSPELNVAVADPNGSDVTVTWYGRRVPPAAGADFTLIGLPDTQYYTGEVNGGSNAIFRAQTDWIVANRQALNIRYVAHLGDCVENGDNGGNPIEWMRADTSLATLENPLTTTLADGIPFGVCVGNHDQSGNGDPDGTTTFYNQYFGEARFQGRGYYGGHYGSNNDNWYDLFSASGMDFIVIGFEFDPTPDAAVLAWADQLLTTYGNRRAIITSHYITDGGNPAPFSAQAQAIYDALKGHSNLFLMLGGHIWDEGRRQDTFNGNTVHSLLADYQGRAHGGNGLLRIMEFSPVNNVIRVRTYSPWLDQYEADADSSSQFTLPYSMSEGAPFQALHSAVVPSGSTASWVWPGLEHAAEYEWYVTVNDGGFTTLGPTWRFTTAPEMPVGVGEPPPGGLGLARVAPNPAVGSFQVTFELPQRARAHLALLDLQGREVAVLADGEFPAGRSRLPWSAARAATRVPSGVYFVRLQALGRDWVRRVVLMP